MSLEELFPTCAICNKRVDRITRCLSPDSWFMIYTVECHGETEETRIGCNDLLSGPVEITGGVAFAQRKLGDR
jgi:hypothetical protein